MAKMKSTKKYYFSVEGETEQWYLKWKHGEITATTCYKSLGISASTFYRLVREEKSKEEQRE